MLCRYKLRPPINEMVEYLHESYGHLWGCDTPMYDTIHLLAREFLSHDLSAGM